MVSNYGINKKLVIMSVCTNKIYINLDIIYVAGEFEMLKTYFYRIFSYILKQYS